MNIKEFEEKHNVWLISKQESMLMSAIGALLFLITPGFMTYFWTTLRIPFKRPVIYYPTNTNDPMLRNAILQHELIHANDMRSSWGLFKMFWLYFFFPLPVLFSGRWLVERKPYLWNIKNNGYDIDRVVSMLWSSYFFPWPKAKMKKWFLEQMENDKNEENIKYPI